MRKRPEPVRTCVGCRQRAAKSELMRVVAVGAALQPDLKGGLPGRGAHLHPDPGCLALAERRKAFVRALRLPGPLDAAAVTAYIARRSGAPTEPPAPQQQAPDLSVPAERADQRDECAMSTNS